MSQFYLGNKEYQYTYNVTELSMDITFKHFPIGNSEVYLKTLYSEIRGG